MNEHLRLLWWISVYLSVSNTDDDLLKIVEKHIEKYDERGLDMTKKENNPGPSNWYLPTYYPIES